MTTLNTELETPLLTEFYTYILIEDGIGAELFGAAVLDLNANAALSQQTVNPLSGTAVLDLNANAALRQRSRLSALATLDLNANAALQQRSRLSALATLDLNANAALSQQTVNPLSGAAVLDLNASAALRQRSRLSALATLDLDANAALRQRSRLSALATLDLNANAALSQQTVNPLSGAAVLDLNASAALRQRSRLSALATLDLDASAALRQRSRLSALATLDLNANAALQQRSRLSALATLDLNANAALSQQTVNPLSGTAVLDLNANATLRQRSRLSALATLDLNANAALRQRSRLSALATLDLNANAALRQRSRLLALATLDLDANAALSQQTVNSLSGTAVLDLNANAALRQCSRLSALATLDLNANAALRQRSRLSALATLDLNANAALRQRSRLSALGVLDLNANAQIIVPFHPRFSSYSSAVLQNLPHFFDLTPQAEVALRVRHADGLRWRIDPSDTLTLYLPRRPEIVLDLKSFTVASLSSHLEEIGFTMAYRNADFAARPASILIPGHGQQDGPHGEDGPHGDHLYGFRSILWAHLKALGWALDDAHSALTALLRQLILPHAQESWADYWGHHFGIPRRTGEPDAPYTQRIIDEFYRARNNPIAMARNVKRYTGADIELFEPWTRMWTLSQSALSQGDDHLPSGDFYCYHWIQPVSRGVSVHWPDVLTVLNADRPAGTLLLGPVTLVPTVALDLDAGPGPRTIQSAGFHTRTRPLWLSDADVLDVNLILSDSEHFQTCLSGWSEVLTRWMTPYWIQRTWETGIWDTAPWNALTAIPFAIVQNRQPVCLGEIVLSDAPPMGDLQAHFPGRRWVETGHALTLNAHALSDYAQGGRWEPIDEWRWATHQSTVAHVDFMMLGQWRSMSA